MLFHSDGQPAENDPLTAIREKKLNITKNNLLNNTRRFTMNNKYFNVNQVQGIPGDDVKTLWISVKSIANETARAEAFKQGLVTMADSGKYPSDFASTLRELSQGIEKVSDYSKNASIVSYYSSVLNKRAIRLTMKDGRHRALFYSD